MKLTKIMLCAAIAGAMTLAASKVSAFPLMLSSDSGQLNTTAYYGTTSATTTNKITKVSYNLKTLFVIITNQVALNSTNPVPKAYSLMYDPYTKVVYLTNNVGYFYNLSNIVTVSIYDIATAFNGTANGGSENDVIGVELDVFGHGPDGLYYEAESYGTGTLTTSLGSTGVAKMTISLKNGSGYAEFQTSDDGNVKKGKFSFSGSGIAPVGGLPYSVWWWLN